MTFNLSNMDWGSFEGNYIKIENDNIISVENESDSSSLSEISNFILNHANEIRSREDMKVISEFLSKVKLKDGNDNDVNSLIFRIERSIVPSVLGTISQEVATQAKMKKMGNLLKLKDKIETPLLDQLKANHLQNLQGTSEGQAFVQEIFAEYQEEIQPEIDAIRAKITAEVNANSRIPAGLRDHVIKNKFEAEIAKVFPQSRTNRDLADRVFKKYINSNAEHQMYTTPEGIETTKKAKESAEKSVNSQLPSLRKHFQSELDQKVKNEGLVLSPEEYADTINEWVTNEYTDQVNEIFNTEILASPTYNQIKHDIVDQMLRPYVQEAVKVRIEEFDKKAEAARVKERSAKAEVSSEKETEESSKAKASAQLSVQRRLQEWHAEMARSQNPSDIQLKALTKDGLNAVYRATLSQEGVEEFSAIVKKIDAEKPQNVVQVETVGNLSQHFSRANIVNARRAGGTREYNRVLTEVVEDLTVGREAIEKVDYSTEEAMHTSLAALSLGMIDLHEGNIGGMPSEETDSSSLRSVIFDTDLACMESNDFMTMNSSLTLNSPLGQPVYHDINPTITMKVLEEHVEEFDNLVASQSPGRDYGMSEAETNALSSLVEKHFSRNSEFSIHSGGPGERINMMIPSKSLDQVKDAFRKVITNDSHPATIAFFKELANLTPPLSDQALKMLSNKRNRMRLHPQNTSIRQLRTLREKRDCLKGYLEFRKGFAPDSTLTDSQKLDLVMKNFNALPLTTKARRSFVNKIKLAQINSGSRSNLIKEAAALASQPLDWNCLASVSYPPLSRLLDWARANPVHTNRIEHALNWQNAHRYESTLYSENRSRRMLGHELSQPISPLVSSIRQALIEPFDQKQKIESSLVVGDAAVKQADMKRTASQRAALSALTYQMWDSSSDHFVVNSGGELSILNTNQFLTESDNFIMRDGKVLLPTGNSSFLEMNPAIASRNVTQHINDIDEVFNSELSGAAFGKENSEALLNLLIKYFDDVDELSLNGPSNEVTTVRTMNEVRRNFQNIIRINPRQMKKFYRDLKAAGATEAQIESYKKNPLLLLPENSTIRQLKGLKGRRDRIVKFLNLRTSFSSTKKDNKHKFSDLIHSLKALPISASEKRTLLNRINTAMMGKTSAERKKLREEVVATVSKLITGPVTWRNLAIVSHPSLAHTLEVLDPERKRLGIRSYGEVASRVSYDDHVAILHQDESDHEALDKEYNQFLKRFEAPSSHRKPSRQRASRGDSQSRSTRSNRRSSRRRD